MYLVIFRAPYGTRQPDRRVSCHLVKPSDEVFGKDTQSTRIYWDRKRRRSLCP